MGWKLAKHANSDQTIGKIADGKFDIIVLQEQSQVPSFPENQRRTAMYEAAKTLVDAAKNSGAIPVFHQTRGREKGDRQNQQSFPNDTFSAMQKRLTDGYLNAAEHSGGVHIVPVGEVWEAVLDPKNEISDQKKLFSPDGSHPSGIGVSVTAAAFFAAIYDETSDPKLAAQLAIARPKLLPYPLPATKSEE